MRDWIKLGFQGWGSAFLAYWVGGNALLMVMGQQGIRLSFRLFAATLVFGFVPGILAGKFGTKKWSAYFGGSILSLIFLGVIVVMSFR